MLSYHTDRAGTLSIVNHATVPGRGGVVRYPHPTPGEIVYNQHQQQLQDERQNIITRHLGVHGKVGV